MGRFTDEISFATKQAVSDSVTGIMTVGSGFNRCSVNTEAVKKTDPAPKARLADIIFAAAILLGTPLFAGLVFGPCGTAVGALVDTYIIGSATVETIKHARHPIRPPASVEPRTSL